MARQVPWNKFIVEEFEKLAMLTELERMVLRLRVSGRSRTQIAVELNVSVSTVDRVVKLLKWKYDKVEKFSPLLPPRKSSAKETWMDTH